MVANSPHLSTIIPAFRRWHDYREIEREYHQFRDGQMVAFDWLSSERNTGEKLLLLAPGIEGEARRNYMMHSAKAGLEEGYDILLLNLRGCGGVARILPKTYHGGEIDDLRDCLNIVLKNKAYKEIVLAGFSLGGNIILNYLGNPRYEKSNAIKTAIAVSVPCDFLSGAALMSKGIRHKLYGSRFTRSLKNTIAKDRQLFEDMVDWTRLEAARSIWDFDDCFTSVIHGFRDATNYYEQVGCINYLHLIDIPCLLINSQNDPMLSDKCYPVEIAKKSSHFYLENSKTGGHVGFMQGKSARPYYASRIQSWISELKGVSQSEVIRKVGYAKAIV